MRYSDEQLARPQLEKGCDYGPGRRAILARNGDRQLLHQAGFKAWGGIGCERDYQPARLILYDASQAELCDRSRDIHEGGRLSRAVFAEHAEAILRHLGVDFDLGLIDPKKTLLLDEPGEITAADRVRPPRVKRAYRTFEGDTLYRIGLDPDDNCRLLTYRIEEQHREKVTLVREGAVPRSTRMVHTHKYLVEAGFRTTGAAACAVRLREYADDVARRRRVLAEESARLDAAEEAYRETLATLKLIFPEFTEETTDDES